ncbi:unnamed protein product [Symbiodinium natans]|uniref:Uncharacterized protein n=1 Tax=Symbiodinium natans TaxID=878477 RepID=A0A812RIP1_9DINO|nr:unnamed protein product [Symbiodinium natans]
MPAVAAGLGRAAQAPGDGQAVGQARRLRWKWMATYDPGPWCLRPVERRPRCCSTNVLPSRMRPLGALLAARGMRGVSQPLLGHHLSLGPDCFPGDPDPRPFDHSSPARQQPRARACQRVVAERVHVTPASRRGAALASEGYLHSLQWQCRHCVTGNRRQPRATCGHPEPRHVGPSPLECFDAVRRKNREPLPRLDAMPQCASTAPDAVSSAGRALDATVMTQRSSRNASSLSAGLRSPAARAKAPCCLKANNAGANGSPCSQPSAWWTSRLRPAASHQPWVEGRPATQDGRSRDAIIGTAAIERNDDYVLARVQRRSDGRNDGVSARPRLECVLVRTGIAVAQVDMKWLCRPALGYWNDLRVLHAGGELMAGSLRGRAQGLSDHVLDFIYTLTFAVGVGFHVPPTSFDSAVLNSCTGVGCAGGACVGCDCWGAGLRVARRIRSGWQGVVGGMGSGRLEKCSPLLCESTCDEAAECVAADPAVSHQSGLPTAAATWAGTQARAKCVGQELLRGDILQQQLQVLSPHAGPGAPPRRASRSADATACGLAWHAGLRPCVIFARPLAAPGVGLFPVGLRGRVLCSGQLARLAQQAEPLALLECRRATEELFAAARAVLDGRPSQEHAWRQNLSSHCLCHERRFRCRAVGYMGPRAEMASSADQRATKALAAYEACFVADGLAYHLASQAHVHFYAGDRAWGGGTVSEGSVCVVTWGMRATASAPQAATRAAARAAWVARWSGLLAVAAQRAIAACLLEFPFAEGCNVAGEERLRRTWEALTAGHWIAGRTVRKRCCSRRENRPATNSTLSPDRSLSTVEEMVADVTSSVRHLTTKMMESIGARSAKRSIRMSLGPCPALEEVLRDAAPLVPSHLGLLSLGELQDPPERCVLVAGRLRRPALSSNRPTASRPRCAATRIRAAPTIGAPTPRGQPQGALLREAEDEVVRLLLPSSADLRCQDDEELRARAGCGRPSALNGAAEGLAAPRGAIYDEVESAPVIWGYARWGTTRGAIVAQLVHHGSAAWLAMSMQRADAKGSGKRRRFCFAPPSEVRESAIRFRYLSAKIPERAWVRVAGKPAIMAKPGSGDIMLVSSELATVALRPEASPIATISHAMHPPKVRIPCCGSILVAEARRSGLLFEPCKCQLILNPDAAQHVDNGMLLFPSGLPVVATRCVFALSHFGAIGPDASASTTTPKPSTKRPPAWTRLRRCLTDALCPHTTQPCMQQRLFACPSPACEQGREGLPHFHSLSAPPAPASFGNYTEERQALRTALGGGVQAWSPNLSAVPCGEGKSRERKQQADADEVGEEPGRAGV